MVEIRNEPCDCPLGRCAHFVEPDSKCVNRMIGDVVTAQCPNHKWQTWHKDGKCLACVEIEHSHG